MGGPVVCAALTAACAAMLFLRPRPATARAVWAALLALGILHAVIVSLAPGNLVNVNVAHYFLGAKHPIPYAGFYRLTYAAAGRPQVALRDLENPSRILRGDPREQRAYFIDLMREADVAFNPMDPLQDLRRRAVESGAVRAEADRILGEALPPQAAGLLRADVGRALDELDAEGHIRSLGREIGQDYGYNGSPFYTLVRNLDPTLHRTFGSATAWLNLAWQIAGAMALVWLSGIALGAGLEERLAMGALLFASWDFVGWSLPGLVFAGLWLPVAAALAFMRMRRPAPAALAACWAALIKLFPLALLLPAALRLARRALGTRADRDRTASDPSVAFSARLLGWSLILGPALAALSLLSGRSWTAFAGKIASQFTAGAFIGNSVSLAQMFLVCGGYNASSPLPGLLGILAATALAVLFLRDDGEAFLDALPRRCLVLLGALGWVVHAWFNYYNVAPLLLLPVVAARHRKGAAISAAAMAAAALLPAFDDGALASQSLPLLHALKIAPYLAVPGWLALVELRRAKARSRGWRMAATAAAALSIAAAGAEVWRLQEIGRLDRRAGAFLDAGAPERALEDYDALVRIHPGSGPARMNRAIALAWLGRSAEAGAGFARAALISPENVPVRVNYARWLAGAGRLDEASAELEAARDQAPWEDGTLLELARLRLRQGRKDEARDLLARVLELNPGNRAVLDLMDNFTAPGQG